MAIISYYSSEVFSFTWLKLIVFNSYMNMFMEANVRKHCYHVHYGMHSTAEVE